MRLMRILATATFTMMAATLLAGPSHARPKLSSLPEPATSTSAQRGKTFFPAPGTNAPRTAPEFGALMPPPANDVCAGAIQLACGNINVSGSTFMATNNYNFTDTTLSCTGYSAGGRDVVYKVTAVAGDSIWLDYMTDTDGSIYIVTNCANVHMPSCVAGADNGELAQVEQLRYRFPSNGTYYIILDSYSPDSFGDWTMVGQFISCGMFPPVNDRCATATKLYCGPNFWSGSTQTAFNDYHFPSAGGFCANSTANGRDVAFRIDVNAGDSLECYYINNNADGVMYIIADCTGAGALCFVGTNETGVGLGETIFHRFTYAGTYYLILDSQGTDTFGSWVMNATLHCFQGAPPNDRCTGATYLPCGPFDLSGSTTLAVNDYVLPDFACTGFETMGNDVTYRLDVSAGDSIWVNYRSLVDGAIYLLRDCSAPDTSCEYGVDLSSTGEIEYLRYKFPQRGKFYLILDAYEPDGGAEWTAVGGIICPQILGVDPPGTPAGLSLRSIVPNPFAMTSTVRFGLSTRGRMLLRIYDLAGRVVRTLVDEELDVGDHSVSWDARDDHGSRVGPGTYYARLSNADRIVQAKMIFVR